jgi:hypothetical protein
VCPCVNQIQTAILSLFTFLLHYLDTNVYFLNDYLPSIINSAWITHSSQLLLEETILTDQIRPNDECCEHAINLSSMTLRNQNTSDMWNIMIIRIQYGVRIEHFFQKNFSKIDYHIWFKNKLIIVLNIEIKLKINSKIENVLKMHS